MAGIDNYVDRVGMDEQFDTLVQLIEKKTKE